MRTRRQADLLDAKLKEAKILGRLGLVMGGSDMPLHEFVNERWLPNFAESHYELSTLKTKASQWNAGINPYLGDVPLREMTREHIHELGAELAAKGLAQSTRRSVLMTLQGMLQLAVEWGYIAENPAQGVRKPRGQRQRLVTALSPEKIEAIRANLEARGRIITSLIAYAGLRPVELRKLEWSSIRERTIYVTAQASKTNKARTVDLWQPLKDDLAEWREHRPSSNTDLIVVGRGGVPVLDDAYKRWQALNFRPAGLAAGIDAPAYDLRHSYVSLLIQSGKQILEIARQAGHKPTLTLETYGHLFDEFDPDERIDPEKVILDARRCPESVRKP